MRHDVARNVLEVLQSDPLRYRGFGGYWWPVKRALKAHGFTRANLYLLGDNEDPRWKTWFRGRDAGELLGDAVGYYADRQFAEPYGTDHVLPDGEPYEIHDSDAE